MDNVSKKIETLSKNKKEMSFVQAKTILDKIYAKYNFVTIVITGGEPTLNKEFGKILQYAAKLFYSVIVTTNGSTQYYKNPDKYENVKFQISIDGNESVHNTVRNNSSYTIIRKNISNLIDNGIKCEVATTVHKENYRSLKKLYEDLLEMNVKCWYVNNLLPIGCAKSMGLIPLDTKLWNDLTYTMHKNCKEISLHMVTQFDLREKNVNSLLNGNKTCKNCGSGVNKIYIYPNGVVYACTCLVDFPIGNIFKNEIEDILASDNNKLITDNWFDEKSACYHCELKEICQGGCKGISYQYFHRFGMGDIRCPKVKSLLG